jgi:putative Holliday junction resolvase
MAEDDPVAAKPPLPGRVMALDLGEKRIGVALSDETRTIARSHAVLSRTSRLADFEKIIQIIGENRVTLLVVGLPIPLNGVEDAMTAWVRDYAADLGGRIAVPVEFWDESFTTAQAQASMRARGKKAKQQRPWVDAVAAAFILQDYLDAKKGDA